MPGFVDVVTEQQRNEAVKSQASSIIPNHGQEETGPPRRVPCIGCVVRLTANPPRQDLPCLNQSKPLTTRCVMCARKKQKCYPLPSDATEFGREFQYASIKRFEGEEAEGWDILGERTLQAINRAKRRAEGRERRPSVSTTHTSFDSESVIGDGISESGQQRAEPREQQPPQQPSGNGPQLIPEGIRQELEGIRTQLHEIQQTIVGQTQEGTDIDDDEGQQGPDVDLPDNSGAQRIKSIVIHFH